MSSELDRRNLVDIFIAEALDGTTVLTQALHPADGTVPPPQSLQEQYIVAHRIRGAAALYGYGGISRLAERLEALLEQATKIQDDQWPRAVGVMREIAQGIHGLILAIRLGESEDIDVVTRCLTITEGLLADASETAASTSRAQTVSQEHVFPAIDPEVMSYFIPEAEEHLTTIDALIRALRAGASDGDTHYRLFRAAHTLKGSAYTVGFRVIGDLALPMEDFIAAIREKSTALSGEHLDAIAGATSVIRSVLRRDPNDLSRLQEEIPAAIGVFDRLRYGQAADSSSAQASAVREDQDQREMFHAPEETAAPVQEPQSSSLSDDYLLPHLDPEVLSYFVPEAREYLEILEANLLRLEKDPQNRELINQLFRTAHTLKGSAYTVGFQAVGDLVHHVEDFMGALRDGRLAVLPGHTDLILRSVDVVRVLLRRDPTLEAETRRRFDAALSELKRLDEGMVVEAAVSQAETITPWHEGPHGGYGEDQARSSAAGGKSAEDRDVIRVSCARLERLMNLVGELIIGRGRLEQRLRVLEQLSKQVLACKTRLMDSVQSFSDKHMFTYQAAPGRTVEPPTHEAPGANDFGSLEFDKYDDFNILARRVSEVTADISESMSQLNGSLMRAHDDMNELEHLTLGMRDEIARARMVPIGTPFTRFRRTIREMARASNKEVSLITSGEQTEVDTGIVERLVDPLVHLVRNAVYHGVEAPAERVSKGKPASGTIYLHAAHRGNSIIIEVEDDGAGLNLGKIRAKAVSMGLVRPEQAKTLTDAEVLQFIFAPGFSTANKVGDQAGRGVGLDVVKQVIGRMNGRIEVESLPDVGTKFTLSLPLTLLIATALLVRVGEERYAIPLPSIREITRPAPSLLQQMGDRMLLHLGEEAIEVRSLREALRGESGDVDPTMPIVIVRAAAGPIGLAVDELLGRQEIVIKTLGSMKPLERSFFGGATIDPEGHVILVVDPGRLGGHELRESSALAVVPKAGLLTDGSVLQGSDQDAGGGAAILLVDDSLSIRKFVGRMLESAGYLVETAVDGEDGLRKSSTGEYRLIITDLEMPRLNGFEVVQALRSRPHTQQTPIVVMTTRAGEKHRNMALSVGANSYIAKPVEERRLLQEVERWIGRTPSLRK